MDTEQVLDLLAYLLFVSRADHAAFKPALRVCARQAKHREGDGLESELKNRKLADKHRSMLAKVCSAAVQGIEAYPVEVEVNVGWGDTKFTM